MRGCQRTMTIMALASRTVQGPAALSIAVTGPGSGWAFTDRTQAKQRRLAQSEALRFSDLRRVAGAILTPIVPVYRRHFHPGQLQFITTGSYSRAKLFESDRFRQDFVEVLQQLRQQMGFRLIGWVLMPEHFHPPVKPEPAGV